MQFERLARGQPQGVVAMFASQLVEHQPLGRRDNAARRPNAEHEAVRRFEFLGRPLVAQIAVVLLVGAVELQQLCFAIRHGGREPIGQRLNDFATEVIAVELDVLGFAEFFRRWIGR